MVTATKQELLRINGDRLNRDLLELARIGQTPKGGVCRLALTDLDRAGREWVIQKAKSLGLSIALMRLAIPLCVAPDRTLLSLPS